MSHHLKMIQLLFMANEVTMFSDGFLLLSGMTICVERFNKGEWPFGRYGCKVFTYTSFIFMYASRFSVVLLAFDRMIAVGAPLKSQKFRNK